MFTYVYMEDSCDHEARLRTTDQPCWHSLSLSRNGVHVSSRVLGLGSHDSHRTLRRAQWVSYCPGSEDKIL